MCTWIVDDDYVKEQNTNMANSSTSSDSSSSNANKVEKQAFLDECNSIGNKLLQLGLQQTINTII
jgi:hypothetical protein